MDFDRALTFLSKLSRNNSKNWFDTHREEYNQIRVELKEFAFQVFTGIAQFDPTINFPTDIKLFRINRDTRFSKNKQPYKDNMGIEIASHGSMATNPGYYIHIQPQRSFIAGGWYAPEREYMNAVRSLISKHTNDFESILQDPKISKTFPAGLMEFEDSLKSVPRGYGKEDPAAVYLRKKHWIQSKDVDFRKIKNPADTVIETFSIIYPFNKFLIQAHKEESLSR